jgi:uncharacterized DUF497 family protein
MSTQFSWDPAKARANEKKHGVTFETAARAFADPFALVELERFEDGEPRWQTIGMIDGALLLLVAHTDWQEDGIEVIRIISARPVTSRERKLYEKNLIETRS